jgi:trehalose 6-phosphate synthase
MFEDSVPIGRADSDHDLVRHAESKGIGKPRSRKYRGRIVVVSHRVHLPVTLRRSPVEFDIAMHSALREKPVMWFGWSGQYRDGPASEPEMRRRGLMLRARIDLPRAEHEGFYDRFAMGALWPVFHSRPGSMEYSREDFAAYMQVNDEFARQLLPLLHPTDLIWIHDYHLIPLAGCLRARGATQKIGFFHHIPFPPPELLVTLPVHEELMQAFTAFDLVGFNATGDAASFASYFTGERKNDQRPPTTVQGFGRSFQVGVFPIGIDVDAVNSLAEWAAQAPAARALRKQLAGRKLITAVDTLDRIKGVVRRLNAIETMLGDFPDCRHTVMMSQIALPDGDVAGDAAAVRRAVRLKINTINRRFGSGERSVIQCAYARPRREDLFAQLRMSAVGLATPLRDGMNLTVKEFIASQNPEDPGIPILSRFTGAAYQLDAALIVNPYDEAATARAIQRALMMPLLERLERHHTLLASIRSYDVYRWRDEFLGTLWQGGDDAHDDGPADLDDGGLKTLGAE